MDPTVSALDRPVDSMLAELGLPPLPQVPAIPLPGMPPVPPLDLTALFKPLTDLAAGFGTGQLGAGGASQVFDEAVSALSSVVSLGTSALSLLEGLWQGQGADAATSKTTAAQSNGTQLASQGTQASTGTQAAAGTVATGAAQMSAIIAQLATSVTAASPALVTPVGQAAVLGMTAESLAQALAVTAKTRAELSAHSAKMTATGRKVPVTSAPKTSAKLGANTSAMSSSAGNTAAATSSGSTAQAGSSNSTGDLTQLIQGLGGSRGLGTQTPGFTSAATATGMRGQAGLPGSLAASASLEPTSAGSAELVDAPRSDLLAPSSPVVTGGTAVASALGPAVSAPHVASETLPGTTDSGASPAALGDAAVSPAQTVGPAALPGTTSSAGTPVMPMSAAGAGLVPARAQMPSDAVHTALMDARNLDEAVGDLGPGTTPIVGEISGGARLSDRELLL